MIPKYRAYHKPSNQICEVYNLDLYESDFTIPNPDENSSDPELTYSFNDDDVVLMRSTRLFDKNGVEVFEGDIVKHESEWSDEPTETYYGEVRRGAYGTWFIHSRNAHSTYTYRSFHGRLNFEVVGNIHTTPELVN